MILECDIGNSRCKWRLLDGDSVVARGVSDCDEQGINASFPANELVSRVRVASVATDYVNHLVGDFCEHRYGRLAEWAVVKSECAGLVCAYSAPERLGVDRWLATVAAYKLMLGAVLVIDVGSALTVDAVDASGVHLGGYILPGERLMKQALFDNTGRVRFDLSTNVAALQFGDDTVSAVGAGIHAALAGSIVMASKEMYRQCGDSFSVILTGGGADSVVSDVPMLCEVVPELVLDGLKWVLP